MNAANFVRVIAAMTILCLAAGVGAAVPNYINYQGRLTDDTGEPVADGDYQITFAIYTKDSVSGVSVWTSGPQMVPVADGLFNVKLGPVPDTVFTSSFYPGSRYLGITVDGYPEATPRIQLVTTPYSYVAHRADTATISDTAVTVVDDAITSAKILNGTVSRFDIAEGQVHSSHLHDGTILFEDVNQNGATAGQVMKWTKSGWVATDDETGGGGDSYWTVTDSILHSNDYWGLARGNADNVMYGVPAYSHTNFGVACTTGLDGGFMLYATIGGGYGNCARTTAATISGGLRNRSNGTVSTIGGGRENRAGGMYSFVGGGDNNSVTGSYSAILGGYADTITSTAGYSYLFGIASKLTEDSTFMVDMPHIRFGNETDGYEFPTTNGAADQILGTDGSGQLGWVGLPASEGWVRDTVNGRIGLIDATDQVGIGISVPLAKLHIQEDGGLNPFSVRVGTSTLFAVKNNGRVGVGTDEPTSKLHIVSSNAGVTGASIYAANSSPMGIAAILENESDDLTVLVRQKGVGPIFRCDSWVGGSHTVFKIENDGRTTCKELYLTGGSDLAEPFQMSEDRELPKGALVVIDENNPGHLKLSECAYDRRVAGVISGAGGVEVGLTLAQDGMFDQGQNVAISGRVYCLADASHGSISPGDMLTTSPTPGHAMKADDFQRAYGSVIGKAMTPLEDGQGLVLVLVSLQ